MMIGQRPFPEQTKAIGKRIITNGFLLIIPILIWNLLFWAKLPEGYSNDAKVPSWLLIAETIFRIGVFAFPLLLTMHLENTRNKIGLLLYLLGCAIYFAAWLVVIFWPETAVAAHPLVLLAPYYTPLIFFAGIGLMGNSILYIITSVLFTFIHTYHGLLSSGFVSY